MDRTVKHLVSRRSYRADIAVALALVAIIAAVYHEVGHFTFINFDDHLYITENEVVKTGLSLDGVRWAFGFTDRAYWHPLTWISHMLDVSLFGLDAGMHHVSNVVYHCLNALALYMALVSMTGQRGRSAFVALLFAVHPVNVDTVAWVAERKTS